MVEVYQESFQGSYHSQGSMFPISVLRQRMSVSAGFVISWGFDVPWNVILSFLRFSIQRCLAVEYEPQEYWALLNIEPRDHWRSPVMGSCIHSTALLYGCSLLERVIAHLLHTVSVPRYNLSGIAMCYTNRPNCYANEKVCCNFFLQA